MKFDYFSLALAAAALAIACAPAGGQTKPEPTKPQSAAPPIRPGQAPRATVGAAVDPNKYLIGPEDILFIKVWRENDFTMPVAVRPDGKITMPLIG